MPSSHALSATAITPDLRLHQFTVTHVRLVLLLLLASHTRLTHARTSNGAPQTTCLTLFFVFPFFFVFSFSLLLTPARSQDAAPPPLLLPWPRREHPVPHVRATCHVPRMCFRRRQTVSAAWRLCGSTAPLAWKHSKRLFFLFSLFSFIFYLSRLQLRLSCTAAILSTCFAFLGSAFFSVVVVPISISTFFPHGFFLTW